MFDRRQNNIDIFMDTENMCRTDKKLIEVIRKSNAGQVIIKDEGSSWIVVGRKSI